MEGHAHGPVGNPGDRRVQRKLRAGHTVSTHRVGINPGHRASLTGRGLWVAHCQRPRFSEYPRAGERPAPNFTERTKMSDYDIHQHARHLGVRLSGPNQWNNYMIADPFLQEPGGRERCYDHDGASAFLCGVEAERARSKYEPGGK